MSGEFSIKAFAHQVLQWLKEHNIKRTNIFGYSMGGYVAMYLAAHHPDVVEKLVTLGTKYEWNETIAAKEAGMLDPEAIERKIPKFAVQLHQRHQPADWKIVLQKTAAMLLDIGKNPPLTAEVLARISAPVLLLIGDRDKMVTLEETVNVFRLLTSGQLGVMPSTQHPIETVDVEQLSSLMIKFLQ
jgi:pimeloyl-ACP methyl ester carboxylesterase